jgi:LemA protein
MRVVKALLVGAAVLLSGCGYNTLQTQDEAVTAAWAEVLNQYQRRADLIPNLVETVKGFAEQEQAVLLGVTEARARTGSIQVTPELLENAESMQQFQAAQGQLTQALKTLFAVTENYPELKSDQNFRDLQAQLEGTENRIAVARQRYFDLVIILVLIRVGGGVKSTSLFKDTMPRGSCQMVRAEFFSLAAHPSPNPPIRPNPHNPTHRPHNRYGRHHVA